jgi:hypothetical protein
MLTRTPFRRKDAPPPRPAKQMDDYTPRPRRTAVAEVIPEQRPVVSCPKFVYVLDKRLRDMCRAMECQLCGAHGRSTWAHSNQAIHGKGGQIKASDVYVAALCPECHHEIDQGHRWSQEVKVAAWNRAHAQTVREAVKRGLWPPGIPVP